jgi:valyl-tRNA synthetase
VKIVDGKKQVERIEGARNFANKLWNAARFVLTKIEKEELRMNKEEFSIPDAWITARLNETIRDVRRLMDDYQYGEAGKLIYDFIWSDFCDWYLEFSKLSLNAGVLLNTLDASLRLLHPFMPYVTEEIWQKLKEVQASKSEVQSFSYPALMLAPYPKADEALISNLQSQISAMASVQDAIRAIRNVRSEYNVAQDKRIPAMISAGAKRDTFEAMRDAIAMLARVEASGLTIAESVPAPEQAVTLALGEATVYLPLAGLVDLAAEKKRLSDELAGIEAQITKSDALLASDFGKRAPPAVIEKEKAKLADLRARRGQLQERLATM